MSQGTRWEAGAVYTRAEGVVVREIAGETILVPTRTDLVDLQAVFALNPSAAWIWDALDGSRTLGEVLAALLERYEVSEREARADLLSLVGRLRDAHLVDSRP